jgi:hypothetical protein
VLLLRMATPLVSSSLQVASDRDASRPSLSDGMHTSLTHAHLPRNTRHRLSDSGLRFKIQRHWTHHIRPAAHCA